MRRAESLLLALACLGISLAWLWLDPEGPRPEAAWRLVRGLGGAVAGLLAALGAGGALVQRLAPELLDDARGLLHAAVAGLLLWALLAGILAALGLLLPLPAAALPALLATGWLARPPLRLPRPGPAAALIGGAVLVLGLVTATAPPVDTDELYQHLDLPARMLESGGLQGGLLHPDGSRPMPLHLVYASAMALGGEVGPRALHLLLALLLLCGTGEVGQALLGPRGRLAPLLLLGSWTFLQPLGLAANDLPVALAVLAALDAALRGRALALALATGLALSIKYTAAGPILGVFLVAAMPLPRRALALGGALLMLSPWWLRNAAEGLHPLFPFAGWDPAPLDPSAPGAGHMPFQYLEKYGAGRGLRDLLALPWNAVMTADPRGFRFLGRLHPLFLALLPTALLALLPAGRPAGREAPARRLFLPALVTGLSWAAGPHWLRYLLPGLPLLALFLAAGAPAGPGLPRTLLLLCGLAGLPANLAPALLSVADRWPAALGAETRADFQARLHPPSEAVAWCNRHLPQDAVVALLFDWSLYGLERRVLLGSVEDHIPARHWLLTHGDRSLSALQAAGATHVLVTTTRFLPSSYPFLPAEDLRRDLQAPVELLDELLLREGTLVFQAGRSRVYRLDAVPAPPPLAPAPTAR